MTTIIIDGKTKAIYTDTRQTKTTTGGSYSLFGLKFKHNKSKQIHLIEDGVKCCYISKEVGYITATGCSYLFDECVRLSKECNELTLPKISDGYNSITIINVKLKGDCLDVIKYKPKTRCGWIHKEHYWDYVWTLMTNNDVEFHGSGAEYAEGAYRAGVSPSEAIIAASKCDHYTNGDVQVYKLVSLTDES